MTDSTPIPVPSGEFADVPWWARPNYVKAMGLALAAVVAAILAALWQFGVIGGDDESDVLPDEPGMEAPYEPGADDPDDPSLDDPEDPEDPSLDEGE